MPGSSTQIAIYDERLKNLLRFDTETNQYSYVMKHVEFSIEEYGFIDESYLYYRKRLLGGGGTKMYLYNYIYGYLEDSEAIDGDTILIQESQSKKYLYVTSEDNLKVFTKENLNRPV